jgi:hypothetical protein
MTPVVVSGRNRPHEVMFLVFSALIGAAFVFGAKPPGTIEQQMPAWVVWTWYGLLLASGVVGLISIAMRCPYRALVLERTAMVGQVAAPAIYGVGLAAYGRAPAVFAAGFCLAWSGASAWRLWQVRREIRAIQHAGRPDR